MQIMRAATPFQRKHFIFQSVRPLAQRRAHRIFRPLQQGRNTILAADPHRQHDRTGRIPQHRPHGSEYRRLSRFHTFDDNRSRCTATRYEILIDYPCIGRKIPSQQSVIKRAGTNACNPFGRNTALGGSTCKQPGGIIVTDITIQNNWYEADNRRDYLLRHNGIPRNYSLRNRQLHPKHRPPRS